MERKILVIDDDTMNRKLFRVLLQKEGYEVFEAGDGAAGTGLARKSCRTWSSWTSRCP